MRIYLVQHAHAHSEEEDPNRPLNEQGQLEAAKMADWAQRNDVTIHQIRHSGKTRARETAEILGEALNPLGGVVAAPGLGPVDDVHPEAEQIDMLTEPVMLVGHLPFMERLTGLLTAGDAELPVVRFQNAGIVCLVKVEDRWQVESAITPELVHG